MAVVSTITQPLRLNKLVSSAPHHLPSNPLPLTSAQSLTVQSPGSTSHPNSNLSSNLASLNPAPLQPVLSGSKQPSSQIPLRVLKPKPNPKSKLKPTSPSKLPAGPSHSDSTPQKLPKSNFKSRRDFLREDSKPSSALLPPSWPGPGTPTIVLDDILLPQSPTEDPLILKVSPRKRSQLLPIPPIPLNYSLHVLSDSIQSSSLAQSDQDQSQDLHLELSVSNPSPPTEPPITSAGTICQDIFLGPTSDTQLQSPHHRSPQQHQSSHHRPTRLISNQQPYSNTSRSNSSPKSLDSPHSPRPGGQGSSSVQVSSPTQRKSLSLSLNTTIPAFLPGLHDLNTHLNRAPSQPIDLIDQQDSDSGSSNSTIMASRALQQPSMDTNLISFSSSPSSSPNPTRSPLKSATNTLFHDLPYDLFHNPPSPPRSPRARTNVSSSSQPFNPSMRNHCATSSPKQPSHAQPFIPQPDPHLQIRGAINVARTSARFQSASPSLRRSRDPSVHSPLNPVGRPSPARAPARLSPLPSSSSRPSLTRPSPSSPNPHDHPPELSSQATNKHSLRSTANVSRRPSLNQHAYAITLLPDRLPSVSEGSVSPSGPPHLPSNAVIKPATPPRPRVWDDENSFAAFQVEDSSMDVDLTIRCDDDALDEEGAAHVRKRQKLSLGHVEMVMSDLGRTMGRAGRRRSALRVRYSADGMGNRSLAEIEEATDEDGERATGKLGAGTAEDNGPHDRVLQDELLGHTQRQSRHTGSAPSPSSQPDDRDSQNSQPHSARRPTQTLSPVQERPRDQLSESDHCLDRRADASHTSYEHMMGDERRSESSSKHSTDDSNQPGYSERAAYLRRIKAEEISDTELWLQDHEEALLDRYSSERPAPSRDGSVGALKGRSGSETRQDNCTQARRPAQPHKRDDARLSADETDRRSPIWHAEVTSIRSLTSSSSVTGPQRSVAPSNELQSMVDAGGRGRWARVIEIEDSESSQDEYESSDGHSASIRQCSSRASSPPGPGGFIRPSEEYASPALEARHQESEHSHLGLESGELGPVGQASSRASSRPGPGGFIRPSEEYASPALEERRQEAGDDTFYQRPTSPHALAPVREPSASSRASSRMSAGQSFRAPDECASRALEERRRNGQPGDGFDEQSVREDDDSQDRQSEFHTEGSGCDEDEQLEYDKRESEHAGPRRTGSRSRSPVETVRVARQEPIFISSSSPFQARGHGEMESEEERQHDSPVDERHSDHDSARVRGSDCHEQMSKSDMFEQDQELSIVSRPNGLERFKTQAMAKHLTSTPTGALLRPSPFPHLGRVRRVSPRARASTPAGASLVEISSADPKVAARVAALLKVHHGFVPHGCKAENAEAMDDAELEMEMEMSIQREEAQVDRSGRGQVGLLRTVQTKRGGFEETLGVRDGSPASASRRSHRSLLEELEQIRYQPSVTRWSQMDWKILEACLRKAQRSRARESGSGSGAGVEAGDVVVKMLGVLEMGIGDCEQEWEWSKMVHRVIALQKRRPCSRGSDSRASSTTTGLRVRAAADNGCPGRSGRGEEVSEPEPSYPSLEPVRRAMSGVQSPPRAPAISEEFVRKASLDQVAYLSRRGKRRIGNGKVWEIIGRFEDRIEEQSKRFVVAAAAAGGGGGRVRSGKRRLL